MFKTKAQDVVGLFKSTGHLIGKDRDLLIPIVYIGLYKSVAVGFVAATIYGFFTNQAGMIFGSVAALLLWVPLSAFLQIRHRAALAWMSFEVLKDQDTDLDSGMNRLSGINGKLFLVAMANMVISNASVDTKDKGWRTYIAALFLSIFQDVWEIVKNFLLPSMAIDKGTMTESVARLKHMKKNIPAAISGVIASDVVGGLAGSVFSLLFLPAIVMGYGAGLVFKDHLPQMWMLKEFNLLPMFIFVTGASFIASFVTGAVDGLKSIYYAVFYTSLVHPMEIKTELQDEITHYLNFNQPKPFDFFAAFKPKTTTTSSSALEIHTSGLDQTKVDKVKKAFAINLPKGHSDQTIEAFLQSKNFSPELIAAGREDYYGESVRKIIPFISEKKGMGYSDQQLEKFLKDKGYPASVVGRALKAS